MGIKHDKVKVKTLLHNAEPPFQLEDAILSKADETLFSVREALKKSNVVLRSANETIMRANAMNSFNIGRKSNSLKNDIDYSGTFSLQ